MTHGLDQREYTIRYPLCVCYCVYIKSSSCAVQIRHVQMRRFPSLLTSTLRAYFYLKVRTNAKKKLDSRKKMRSEELNFLEKSPFLTVFIKFCMNLNGYIIWIENVHKYITPGPAGMLKWMRFRTESGKMKASIYNTLHFINSVIAKCFCFF